MKKLRRGEKDSLHFFFYSHSSRWEEKEQERECILSLVLSPLSLAPFSPSSFTLSWKKRGLNRGVISREATP